MILIDREKALSHPFANGNYDHKNANRDFIRGFESYKEWLEDLPTITINEEKEPVVEQYYSKGRIFVKGTIDIREGETMSNLTRDDVREMIEEMMKKAEPIGEWQKSKASKRVWHCSLCRRGYIIKNEKYWNYCPYCGAKMERRTDE